MGTSVTEVTAVKKKVILKAKHDVSLSFLNPTTLPTHGCGGTGSKLLTGRKNLPKNMNKKNENLGEMPDKQMPPTSPRGNKQVNWRCVGALRGSQINSFVTQGCGQPRKQNRA